MIQITKDNLLQAPWKEFSYKESAYTLGKAVTIKTVAGDELGIEIMGIGSDSFTGVVSTIGPKPKLESGLIKRGDTVSVPLDYSIWRLGC